MSNDKNIPSPPPDDFSKTTPNANLPDDLRGGGTGGSGDWDKTNYSQQRPPAAAPDDFGKTVINVKPADAGGQPDYGKTMYPGARNVPEADWGMTQANVDMRSVNLGGGAAEVPEDFGGGAVADKTTPYFSLPEAERAKYQNLPPTPAQQAEQEKQEQKEKGGVPGWFWVAAGLMTMFFFAVVVLGIVFFFFMRDTSFAVTVKGAPVGSTVTVDDIPWGVTNEGDTNLLNLKAGRRTIKIVHPNYTCEPREITGGNGTTPEPIIARCQAVTVKPGEDCNNIQLGEFDKAERCYNKALDELPDPFTPEDLVRALNILIINFDSGKSEVPAVRLAALQKGAGYIKKLPTNVVLEVGGHTDNVGNDASNQTLSDARANSVKEKLVQFGVRSESLQTRGYGATRPKPGADNNTEKGRFYNRRIEYSIVKK